MIFATPWVLLALPALPLLWWLLRITPPEPRLQSFPAIRLLAGLDAMEETPARTPRWLLLLRMLAAGLVILALARPILDAGRALAGDGPLLLVLDNGWAAAADWPKRLQAAGAALDTAERTGRKVALLTTAPDEAATEPKPTPVMPVPELRPLLAALRPLPWGTARDAAALSLADWRPAGAAVIYIADGLAQRSAGGVSPAAPDQAGPGRDFGAADSAGLGAEARFAAALRRIGPVTEICCGDAPGRVLLPPRAEDEKLVARVAQVPLAVPTPVAMLAQSGDGRTLARAGAVIPAGTNGADIAVSLPVELRNRLARLVLDGPPSVAAVVLLDESWRRRPVGLLAGDLAAADSPLTGPLFYLRRALAPYTELREADITTLLRRDISVIVLADRPLSEGLERDALDDWVKKGGLLIRFAGPRTAEQPVGQTDRLMPEHLLGGDRQLGGALSWSHPAGLAAFPPGSPFAGLAVPDEVAVTRQVLAEPSAQLAGQTWAALSDGTPLVTAAAHGAGRIVLFHVTANADWSNLPLSGLFVDMLRRLVQLAAGVPPADDASLLAPSETMDGTGVLTTPPPAATGLRADAIARTAASPRHPPGLYGPENGRRALNLGTSLAEPAAAALLPGAAVQPLGAVAPERSIGPWLLTAAIVLLAIDLLIALFLRGLLGRRSWRAGATPRTARALGGAALLLLFGGVPAQALDTGIPPALETRLAYVITGDEALDGISRAGLEGLSDYVNHRTAASLAEPDGVVPGHDDMSFYPLLYWPVSAQAPPLDSVSAQALNDYMSRGGIVLLDTRGGGQNDGAGPAGGGDSGAGFAPGTDSALKRVTQGLLIPALAPLTTEHVLSRSFYLLQDFPGRYDGGTVWVQRDQDRANDSVSPVIVGGNDWAAAWAIDADGRNPYAVIPGGAHQRTMAYRFGVNLVMYALTGNYKGDQVHVPAILERLGQ